MPVISIVHALSSQAEGCIAEITTEGVCAAEITTEGV